MLSKEETDISAVYTDRTVVKTIVTSADYFLLTRKVVVHFDQNAIASTVDRQRMGKLTKMKTLCPSILT